MFTVRRLFLSFLLDSVILPYLEVSSEQAEFLNITAYILQNCPSLVPGAVLSKGVDQYLPNNGAKPVLMTVQTNGTTDSDFCCLLQTVLQNV